MDYSAHDSMLCLPLGGCGQFGANMTVYGHAGRLIAVDCGIGFADDTFPGVDILMPDVDWLAQEADHLDALIITHAHEDHIGAVAWLWPRLQCPIYVSEFASHVLARKFSERNYDTEPDIRIITPNDVITINSFTVHSTAVTHSTPETMSLMIETDAGRILHTGDWNLDPNPILGQATDLDVFRKWGDEGILAMVGDSTNAPVEGRSASESDAAAGLAEIFKNCEGRIAITIFSSNIGRVMGIHRAAKACGRHVGLIGRSLKAMVDTAKKAGVIAEDVTFVSEEDLGHLPNEKVVMVVTGSQGEPRAALSKIARGMNRDVSLKAGDTVIFSARSIPGNERGILDIKNLLAESGVHVIDPDTAKQTVHVSGHPKREELKEMLQAVRPQIVIPVHGEYQMQAALAQLAQDEVGAITTIPGNGTVMTLSKTDGVKVIDHLEINDIAVDFDRVVSLNSVAIQQRRRLSFNGSIFLSLVLDEESLELLDLQITTLGLIDEDDPFGQNLLDQAIADIEQCYDNLKDSQRRDADALAHKIRPAARRVFKNTLRARPATEIHVSLV